MQKTFETKKAGARSGWIELNTEEFRITYSFDGDKAKEDVVI
jgi:hypothetical protein